MTGATAYGDLIANVLLNGETVRTRNSVVKRITTQTVKFDHTPLVVERKTAWKLALREWEFFMSGSSDINDLHPSVRHW
jgi:thymidylate synthase